MLVLAIDTSTNIGTVALYDDKKGVIGEITLNVKQNHSAITLTTIDTLFQLSGIDKKVIDKVAVSIGPGSFTGIRIGVGLAKGLAYALKKPIAGINELDLLANTYTGDKKVVAMLDARKERVFSGVYKKVNDTFVLDGEYMAEELENILNTIEEETVFVGDGAFAYEQIIKDKLQEKSIFIKKSLNISRASLLAELAVNKEDNLFTLEPYYVTKSQAEREKEGK
ncbi:MULTISPECIES: tRNA (adenosine(37)-N6)-threonylcarbamoyltransferase complex dimerization subunit type 1 TsaB [Cetobacterium]|jgi:N6-L-threonylcarbamoyladenine synthase|uniref:tRNA (Adenosine(37)-N6)-threonylcarbamoyltransferase complex dimerization subunit type 1 TsaB n=1 Tax=Candidatus Cetobacterium colombiensis TaxID=3073100 RepID=A0ABU4W846_9FUSO|nr:tRNA (adenosine(37)-N6)-threonylcarbamoyltransferase complex dimerization subunit type 1 TsaB [Candidatus Cetobacterium colombiensis]MDX8335696.1 tRNA (adenosine(37)-N6)-threonylcarbamoyltransferase complex dimerization subunit type 1 TsaB [Candidatus Cetobacterium colombiensis]